MGCSSLDESELSMPVYLTITNLPVSYKHKLIILTFKVLIFISNLFSTEALNLNLSKPYDFFFRK